MPYWKPFTMETLEARRFKTQDNVFLALRNLTGWIVYRVTPTGWTTATESEANVFEQALDLEAKQAELGVEATILPPDEDEQPRTFACHHVKDATCDSCRGIVERWKATRLPPPGEDE